MLSGAEHTMPMPFTFDRDGARSSIDYVLCSDPTVQVGYDSTTLTGLTDHVV